MSVQLQYNGYVLLYSYLQRFYVSEKVNTMLGIGEMKDEKMESLKLLLNELGEIGTYFQVNKSLSVEYKEYLIGLTDKVRCFTDDYKQQITDAKTTRDYIPLVASTLYAEDHVNNGIVNMGRLFNPEIADRYMQKIPYFRQRIGWINSIVYKAGEGKALTEEETEQLKNVFATVYQVKDEIDKDFATIKSYMSS